MTAREDDEAFRWEGDDEPVHAADAAEPADRAEPAALPEGFTAVGKGSETVGRRETGGGVTTGVTPPVQTAPLGNAALIGLGVLGGVYLLFAIGWVIGGQRLQGRSLSLVSDVMFQGSYWLAILAAPIWFATTYLLTRRARPWVRFAVLVAGMVLLVPWPFVMAGTVGQ